MSPKTNESRRAMLAWIIESARIFASLKRKPVQDIRGIGVVAQAKAIREFLKDRGIRVSIRAHTYSGGGEVMIRVPDVEHIHDWELPGAKDPGIPQRRPCETCGLRARAKEALEQLIYAAFIGMNDPRGPLIFQ